MAVTVTELAAEVKESNQRRSAAIESLNVEVAKIVAESGSQWQESARFFLTGCTLSGPERATHPARQL
jgi:hypothetical protein